MQNMRKAGAPEAKRKKQKGQRTGIQGWLTCIHQGTMQKKQKTGAPEAKGKGAKGRRTGLADLRAHEDEAKGVDSPHKGVEHKAVPAAVCLIHQGPDGVTHQNGVQHIAQVADGIGVMPLGLTGTVVPCHATSHQYQGLPCNMAGQKG